MTNLREPIDALPFGQWVDEQVDRFNRDETKWADGSKGVRIPAGYRLVAELLGVTDDWVRKGAWRRTLQIERAVVEDALDRVDGVTFTDLYPELEARGSERTLVAWCDGCSEQTTPLADGTCPWCGGKTLGGDGPIGTCGCGCGQPIRLFDKKSRPVKWRRGHAPRSLEQPKPPVPIGPFVEFVRDVVMVEHPAVRDAARALGLNASYLGGLLDGTTRRGETKRVMERKTVQRALRKWGAQGRGKPWRGPSFSEMYESLVCPGCQGPKARAARRCKACSKGKPRRRKAAKSQTVKLRPNVKMTAQTLGRARRLHVEQGLSLREVARELLPATGYSSESSMAQALSTQFRARGWEVRDQSAATAVANRRRAYRPFCKHVLKVGQRKGERCDRRSVGEDGYCYRHHPDRIAAGIARLRKTETR